MGRESRNQHTIMISDNTPPVVPCTLEDPSTLSLYSPSGGFSQWHQISFLLKTDLSLSPNISREFCCKIVHLLLGCAIIENSCTLEIMRRQMLRAFIRVPSNLALHLAFQISLNIWAAVPILHNSKHHALVLIGIQAFQACLTEVNRYGILKI